MAITLFGNGSGRLGFVAAPTATERLTAIEVRGIGHHTISVPIVLADQIVVSVYNAAGRLACTGGS